jgi:hypothetical protein
VLATRLPLSSVAAAYLNRERNPGDLQAASTGKGRNGQTGLIFYTFPAKVMRMIPTIHVRANARKSEAVMSGMCRTMNKFPGSRWARLW